MEGVPFFPEDTPDDTPESSKDTKDKKGSKRKKLPLFEQPETESKDKKSVESIHDDTPEKNKDSKDIPLESLADDEKQAVAEQYIAARTEEVADELTDVADDSPDEVAVLANAALLENIQERLANAEPLSPELLDEVVAETVEELGFEADAPVEPEVSASEPDEAAEETPLSTPPPTIAPPSPPSPPPPASPPSSRASGGGMPPIGPSAAFIPTPPSPNVLVVPSRKRERTNLLVGGILGYMIGRRRGRIKTEKRLLPVQEKLKKEVIDLHAQIAQREEGIRKIAHERALRQPIMKERVAERIQEKLEIKKNIQARPEKIGKVAVFAEHPTEKVVEREVARTPEKPKPVSLMTVPELVSIAANISVEQSTVKRLYEMNRLSDEGLRRIVQAYLRGERLERVIQDTLRVEASSPEMQKRKAENHGQESHDQHRLLKQALEDQGTGSTFALPALNTTQKDEYNPYVPTGYEHSGKTKVVAPLAIIATVIAVIFIIFMSS